mmetsp:Transcript_29173/g.72709  ORF Transcript_29173/g.72709 Transcript_29173/m.72709 type:complete len:246 (+) Transcript_29173:121-858(+)
MQHTTIHHIKPLHKYVIEQLRRTTQRLRTAPLPRRPAPPLLSSTIQQTVGEAHLSCHEAHCRPSRAVEVPQDDSGERRRVRAHMGADLVSPLLLHEDGHRWHGSLQVHLDDLEGRHGCIGRRVDGHAAGEVPVSVEAGQHAHSRHRQLGQKGQPALPPLVVREADVGEALPDGRPGIKGPLPVLVGLLQADDVGVRVLDERDGVAGTQVPPAVHVDIQGHHCQRRTTSRAVLHCERQRSEAVALS